MTKKAAILGAGPAGATVAYLLSRDGWDCTVIDKNNYIGGGCWTLFYGGHPYTEGPHHYYGYSEKIFSWLSDIIPMHRLTPELYSFIESEKGFFSFPPHKDDIEKFSKAEQIKKEQKELPSIPLCDNLEKYWTSRVGPTLYELFVKHYSKKRWFMDDKEFQAPFDNRLATVKEGSRDAAITDITLAYPSVVDGYNKYFEMSLEKSTLVLGEKIIAPDLKNKKITFKNGKTLEVDIIISTIPLDELFGYSKGETPFSGRQFIPIMLPCKEVFPGNMIYAYYTENEPQSRIVEYKKLTRYKSNTTLLVMEIPIKSEESRLYPYDQHSEYKARANAYLESLPEGVFSIGRAGSYQYISMEHTIAQAFRLYNSITGKSTKESLEDEFYDDLGNQKKDHEINKPLE